MEMKEVVERIGSLGQSFMEFKKGIEEKVDEISKRIDEIEAKATRPSVPEERKPDVKKAFFQWLRTGIAPEEMKALVEDSSTATVLVPQEIYSEIITELPKISVVRKLAKAIPVKGNSIDVRSFGDVSVSWAKLETGGTLTESTPSVSKNTIAVHDLVGLTKIGRDLLQDTDVALERVIIDSFTRKIAEAEDQAFLVGDGNDKPLGILESSITSVSSGTAGALSIDDLFEVYFALPEQYRANAVWVMHPAIEKHLRKIKDSNGQYLIQPDLSSQFGRTLFGRPVINSEHMASSIASGNDVILFGDFSNGFIILDKVGGMSVQRLDELYATSGQIGVLVYYRVGGGVIRSNAFVKLTIS